MSPVTACKEKNLDLMKKQSAKQRINLNFNLFSSIDVFALVIIQLLLL